MTDRNLKKQAAEEIWLGYFNRILYEKGIITERERNRMILLIANRQMPAKSEK